MIFDTKGLAEYLKIPVKRSRVLIRQMNYINLSGANDKPHLRVSEEEVLRWVNEHTVINHKPVPKKMERRK